MPYRLAMKAINKADFPSQLAEKFIIRLPSGMREQIRTKAAENHRSMNAEVIARLEQSLEFASRYPYVDRMRIGDKNSDAPRAAEPASGYRDADIERELIKLVRSLTSDQRRALLVVLGNTK